METATELGFKERDKEIRKRAFEQRMESFINDWSPEDHYSRSAFAAQLMGLIREVYADAQAPLLDNISKIAMAMPWPPAIMEKK